MSKPPVDPRPYSEAKLIGRLESYDAPKRKDGILTAHVMVDVDGQKIWLFAKGEPAEKLESMSKTTTVRVTGKLVNEEWPRQKMGEGKRLVIEVETVERINPVTKTVTVE